MYVHAKSLMADIPALSFDAIALAWRRLEEKTLEPNENGELFAKRIASSSLENFIIAITGPKTYHTSIRQKPMEDNLGPKTGIRHGSEENSECRTSSFIIRMIGSTPTITVGG